MTSPDRGGHDPRPTRPAQLRREQSRRVRRRRRRAAGIVAVVALLIAAAIAVAWPRGSSSTRSTLPPATPTNGASSGGIPSIEAGVEPWQLGAPVSREVAVPGPTGLTLLGGLNKAGASVSRVQAIRLATGSSTRTSSLASAVHDASGTALGESTFIFGGGSPTTVATVQSIRSTMRGAGATAGTLPAPRSDSATVTISSQVTGRTAPTAFVIGGYTGVRYLRDVLATADGTHFDTVAALAVPVRYPAVAAAGGLIYTFGGQIPTSGRRTAATNVIQAIDPLTRHVTVVGHLPRPMYGAAAFLLGSTIYVAGGQVPNGPTLTTVDAFVPTSHRVLHAGLLPQAVAFGGYTTVGTGPAAVGYIAGGEVTAQAGPEQAGVASGTLSTVISLRPSPYGGSAGASSAGAPFAGTLLIADRGNNRLIAINPSRRQIWKYPSAGMPAPPGGFYFPDDSFFIRGGTGIISNQEDNHTIVEIAYPSGKLLWQYGHPGVTGTRTGYLNQPDDAYLLKSGTVSVADASNNRILFISPARKVIGQIGNGVDAHRPPTSIAYPNGDTPLANGNLLVSEINGSWVDEYTTSGKLVWSTHMPSVKYPSDPQQLGPNSYLMTDYNPQGAGSVLEFSRGGRTLWRYGPVSGDAALKKPSLAERLPNGLIMVNDDYRNRLVVIDPATKSIVWQYGITDAAGAAAGKLAIPDGFDLLLANHHTPTHPQTG